MKAFFLAGLLLLGGVLRAQTVNTYYQTIVTGVQYDTVFGNLQTFESFGPKSVSSQALRNTANWLCSEYASFGYTDVVRDTFSYSGNELYNIVVTKTGLVNPGKTLIICGHYDTQTGPGTNDNGSGVSIILEIARLMQSIPTEYSVKFIHFSAEESGLLGSEHYVGHTVVTENPDILLVFNIDEVGGVAGQVNNTITCEYDNTSPSANNAISGNFTDTLANLTELYSSLFTTQSNAYGSDYVPFEDNGEIITGYYETNESSYVHSSSDNLSHLDTSYVVELARAATGAALYFARAYQVVVGMPDSETDDYSVFPNPVLSGLTVRSATPGETVFTLYNVNGARLVRTSSVNQEFTIDLSAFPPAMYYYTIIGNPQGRLTTGKLIRQ